MHDIDRVRLETQSEAESFGVGEFEAEHLEFGETGQVFGETENMELASELLEVSNEYELEQFLGDLVGKAGQALGRFVSSPSGKALVGVLKDAARQVLPSVGSSVGRYFGGDTGAKLGGQVADAAGRAFGLELEGLSGEDREFEVARRYVNFAGQAVRNLVEDEAGGSPLSAAQAAAIAAAQTHAPGLLQGVTTDGLSRRSSSGAPVPHGAGAVTGRWVRHGNNIIVHGV